MVIRLDTKRSCKHQCKVLCVQSCQQLVNSGVVNTKVHWGYFARRGLWQGIARIYLQPKDNTWFRYLLFYFGQNLLQYQSEQSDNVALPYLVRFPNPLAFGLPKVRRGPCLLQTLTCLREGKFWGVVSGMPFRNLRPRAELRTQFWVCRSCLCRVVGNQQEHSWNRKGYRLPH